MPFISNKTSRISQQIIKFKSRQFIEKKNFLIFHLEKKEENSEMSSVAKDNGKVYEKNGYYESFFPKCHRCHN